MKKITLLFIGMLLLSAALFAGGEPRVLYVRLVNHDGTSLVNDPSVLDFTATLSGDTQNDTSPDFGYYFVGGNMYLKIQLANFAGVWAIGQTVYIDVTRTDPAGTGSCEVIIPEGFSTIWWGRPPSASGTVYPGEPITINPTGPPPVTYTLNIAIDDTVSPGGTYTINDQPYQAQLVDDNDEVNDLIGTYTISDAPEGYYWSVNPIVVSEADFDPDTNIANITFVLVANPDSWTYKMKLTASDGGTYNFTGPVSGVTGTEYSTGPQTTSNNPYLGAYTVTSEPPMGYTWVNTQVELGPDDFISAKADYVFMATKQFVLQLMPITYTLNIVFPDGYTITGPGGPFTTSPAVVTDNDDTVNDLIGNVYTASDAPAGFHWVVNPIEVTAEMFENNAATITFELQQDPEPPVPVELSSFTATLTGQFYVQLSWTTQTETQMVGYRVYRSTTADQSTIELIDNPLVPATNTSTTQNYTVVDKDVLIGQTYYYWLEAVDYNNSNFHGPVSVTVTGNVPPVLPEVTEMKNAYPNPFKANSSTNIEVSLKAGDTGTLSIYNVQGQLVKIVSLTEGTHMVNWNGRDTRGNACGSGIYFYKLSTQSMNQTKKMVIVK
jgi:hypothetical protein